jgi:hypothetical protein
MNKVIYFAPKSQVLCNLRVWIVNSFSDVYWLTACFRAIRRRRQIKERLIPLMLACYEELCSMELVSLFVRI